MTSTDLERRLAQNGVALFPGATAADIIAVAADTATQFAAVVKQQRMFKRIGDNDHIQIEAWQTIGALTGVLATDGEVEQIPWPQIEPLPEEPPVPAREPRDRNTPQWREWKQVDTVRRLWELHDAKLRAQALGRAYGFVARFRATKNGEPVGWGEGRCERDEASKVAQDDYALSSMAQTRAQSRALGAPLKFIVQLAGYKNTTPAEEMDSVQPAEAAPALPWGPVASDEQMEVAAGDVAVLFPDVDGHDFVVKMGTFFDGVPAACVAMLHGLVKFTSGIRNPPENAPPDDSGYRTGAAS